MTGKWFLDDDQKAEQFKNLTNCFAKAKFLLKIKLPMQEYLKGINV